MSDRLPTAAEVRLALRVDDLLQERDALRRALSIAALRLEKMERRRGAPDCRNVLALIRNAQEYHP